MTLCHVFTPETMICIMRNPQQANKHLLWLQQAHFSSVTSALVLLDCYLNFAQSFRVDFPLPEAYCHGVSFFDQRSHNVTVLFQLDEQQAFILSVGRPFPSFPLLSLTLSFVAIASLYLLIAFLWVIRLTTRTRTFYLFEWFPSQDRDNITQFSINDIVPSSTSAISSRKHAMMWENQRAKS